MEKLLELLNEYDGTPNERKLVVDKLYLDGLNVNSELFECLIISKYYGFIQWLVDNDKIDKDKIDICYYDRNGTMYGESDFNSYSDYESLLMLLSIQDNPIEFLCSVLR